MPSLRVKVPVGTSILPHTFAHHAKVKAGLTGLVLRSKAPLPGPDLFKGLGSLFGKGSAPLPGPNVFPAQARGMGAFCINANPVLPGPNVFQRFFGGKPFPGAACTRCSKPCKKRGMGDDTSLMLAPDNASSLDLGNGNISDLFGIGLPSSALAPAQQAPLLSTSDIFGSTLAPAQAVTASPIIFTSSGSGWQPGGSSYAASTNPSLDAYNQALTNAQANNPALNVPSNLAALSQAAGAASPAQLQQAAKALNAQAAPSGQTFSQFLNSSTLITGYANSTVLLGGGALGVLAVALMNARKGKR
jgi:hypothetical protein